METTSETKLDPMIQAAVRMVEANLENGRKLIPEYMFEPVKRYVMNGIPMGHFGTAVFENDLLGAFERADSENSRNMRGWAQFVYTHCPSACHGSQTKVKDWAKAGGQLGYSRRMNEMALREAKSE